MPSELDNHYILPDTLRSQLGEPMGTLIKGSIHETIPLLKKYLLPKKGKIIGVGDVTAQILVKNQFNPDIIVTDGKTKRQTLDIWERFDGFQEIETVCPAGQITPHAWSTLKKAIELSSELPIHVLVDGEEDLLVLPLVLELPLNSFIVYGQPNVGVVIRKVSIRSQQNVKEIISQMILKK